MLPRWTFDDAYVDFENEKFTSSLQNLDALIGKIYGANLPLNITAQKYQLALEEANSLLAFCRCKSSENTKDERVGEIEAKIQASLSKLEEIKENLFEKFDKLSADDKLWREPAIATLKFLYDERKNSWRMKLSKSARKIYDELAQASFTPLYGVFRHLNNLINIEATDQNGVRSTYNLAKCGSVLKGSPDGTLRKSVFEGLQRHYDKHASLYVDVLNLLQGFRLDKFKRAGVDRLTPSFEQNKISAQVVGAMFEALELRLESIRECVNLRSKYFENGKIYACDLLAPSPRSSKAQIPYESAIDTICEALGEVGEEIPGFIRMMLQKGWIEAGMRENKAGGAFYTRFDKFKQPRVFSTYMGTQAHMIQQAHELGHAWHYWIMRDMPSVQTHFPMSLAETASTFNEAVLRNYLRKNSTDKNLLFDILWQELKSAANFMLHISVRYEFETAFLAAREEQILTAAKVNELMLEAWRKWYGGSVQDAELFLPYFKLHFYKTDQYIYNYPYTVGYLLSQFLLGEFKMMGAKFIGVYKKFLRDCGRMSVEALLKKYFDKDVTKCEFWLLCIDNALSYAQEFKRLETELSTQ